MEGQQQKKAKESRYHLKEQKSNQEQKEKLQQDLQQHQKQEQ